MKTIILAAGYATRLGELTRDFPKPLLQIGSTTILDRMLDDIDTIADITGHIVVTNHRFAHIFNDWQARRLGLANDGTAAGRTARKPVTIIDDGTTTNGTRLGAVCDLLLAIRQLAIDDDLLVAAADNLLYFRFQEFVDFARQKNTSCIMCHNEPSTERLQRTGVIEADQQWRVLSMEEKPQQPKSHWAVPPFYIYLKHDLPLVRSSVANGCGKDAPGNLARYMVSHTTVHAWPMTAGRFDIGSPDSYREAQRLFSQPTT